MCAAAACAYLVLARAESLAVRVTPLLVAAAAYAVVLWSAARGAGPGTRLVVGAAVVTVAVAVAVPPARSNDVYLYGLQGRMVAVHGASPYRHPATEFAGDPLFDRVAPPFRTGVSSYGPAFTGLEAVVAAVSGPSPTRVRLIFQGLAGAALLACVWLLHQRGAGPGALAFLALNPVVATKAVNEAHLDVLVGLALLVAVLAAERGRLVAAAVVTAVAVLTKILAVVALAALLVWALASRGTRAAVRAGAVAAVTVACGYAAAGGLAASGNLEGSALLQSRASIWALPRHRLTAALVDDGWRGVEAGEAASRTVARWAAVVVLVVAGLVVLAVARRASPALAVGGAYLAYLLAGAYAPAWYAAAALPVLALVWRSPLALVAAAHAALVAVAYVYWPVRDRGPDGAALRALFTTVLPALEVVALVAIAAVSTALVVHRRRPALAAPST